MPAAASPGTAEAKPLGMAAVFALVLLPLIASIGFFFGAIRGDISPSSAFAAVTFLALGIFVFGGALRIARDAEGPAHQRH